jgi:hypothetical protein
LPIQELFDIKHSRRAFQDSPHKYFNAEAEAKYTGEFSSQFSSNSRAFRSNSNRSEGFMGYRMKNYA